MQVHQFRCWPSGKKAGVDNGYSNVETVTMFSGSNILANSDGTGTYSNVSQLGIQGAPGTRFWLNDSILSSNPQAQNGIVLNWTGIFEIDLSDIGGEINSIIFSPDSKNLYINDDDPSTQEIVVEPNNYKLIVDILYDNGGVE